jgi:DNA-binding FadR family transcriptional regulator
MLINLLCSEFYPLLRLYRGDHATPVARRERALVEHRRILDAIADRDPDLAELHMRRHITYAREWREIAISAR